MAFRDLFIVDDEKQNDKPKPEKKVVTPKQTTSFPENSDFDTEATFTPSVKIAAPSSTGVSQEHLDKFTKMYEDGFASLNQEGFDFFDFFVAINNGGLENPTVYSMAMAMGKTMDKTLTKDKLIVQADAYLAEINKVYTKQVSGGSSKKSTIISQKDNETQLLKGQINDLKAQLDNIKSQISSKETELSTIDGKYQPMIADMDSKIMANDLAKNKIVNLIETVRDGLNKNVK